MAYGISGGKQLDIVAQRSPQTPRGLKIALVTETYPPETNGVAMTLGNLVRGLTARGNEVQLVRPRQPHEAAVNGSHPGGDLLRPSIGIPRYSGLRLGFPSGSFLQKRWSESRPDLVHVVTEGPLGYTALRAARKLGIPVSTGFHTNFHQYTKHYGIGLFRSMVAKYLRHFHNAAACTLVPAEDVRQNLADDGYRNLFVVGRGIETCFSPTKRCPRLREDWKVGEADLAIIYVGRIAPEKNIELAVRAYREIRKEHPSVRMIFCGDGPDRGRLQADYPECVFGGVLSREELARHYASADLFLFPSMTETYGNVLMEALACGMITVSFDYAAAKQFVRHGHNGFSVPFGDEAGFIHTSIEVARQARARRDVAREARNTTASMGWEKVVMSFESILKQVANKEIA